MSVPSPTIPHDCFDCGSTCKLCWTLNRFTQWVHKGDPWACRCAACPTRRPPPEMPAPPSENLPPPRMQ